jgi:methionine--tRNA ligase beta chain
VNTVRWDKLNLPFSPRLYPAYNHLDMENITITELQKIDLRIGTILAAERVTGSTKLIKLIIDLGAEKRQILAGLGEAIVDPQSLVGKQIPLIANLQPRQMMGLESQGMILAADDQNQPVLLHPAINVPPGSRVR